MRQLSVWKHRDWGIREFFTDNYLFSHIFFVTTCSQKVNKNTQHENKPTK